MNESIYKPLTSPTEEEIVEKWEKTGILTGYDDETSKNVAVNLEEIVRYFDSSQKNLSEYAPTLFPILCHVTKETGKKIHPFTFISLVYECILQDKEEIQDDCLKNLNPTQMIDIGDYIIKKINA